eukprot:CAMPEP_0176106506 /NCGR_PEP_ID=MMETSP0120_2-20121206/53448_1 /TAXON_ID=160619 /ORGANISM="Kryptoperidinium foliaceum, Strain CCMP 1326" /LENGTH=1202 /DNA_ID=CAMNT_0017440629 /DNA_START=57 /DNA_END=3665 /DNA_ORIENTATION=+
MPVAVPVDEVPVERTIKRKNSGDSLASKGSATSKSSKLSKISLSSKLSGLVRRSGSGFSVGSRNTTTSVAAMVDLEPGDFAESVSLVTIRKAESLESEVITELAAGCVLQVVAVGEGRRIKIKTVTSGPGFPVYEGWVSSKTKMNEPLVQKRVDNGYGCGDFEVGGQHEVKSIVTVRTDECLESDVLCDLKPGAIIRIIEIGQQNNRRAKVITADGIDGWISTVTKHGELLIGKVEDCQQDRSAMFGASSSKIKTLLESARSGNLEQMKKVVEGNSGVMSRFSSRPNLNASDIRGKTALIYAAAFGNKDIVEYLLTRTREVDVNALDDTQKTALHHASKRARVRREGSYDEVQADIVTMLLHNGAYMEARDHNGCTALMFAVANGDEAVAKRLLTAQANVNVKDFEGHMPLDYARNFKHEVMVKMLIAAGAVSAEDDDDDEDDSPEEAQAEDEPRQEEQKIEQSEEVKAPVGESVAEAPAAEAQAAKKKASGKKKAAGKASAKKKADKEDKEDKPSAKKKGAKGKGDAMKKVMSSVMMEAVDEEEHAVTVQEQAKEEEDDKTRALRKLKIVVESVTAPKELETAIKEAEMCGADEAEVADAVAKVKELKTRQAARDQLKFAIEEKDCKALREAIAKASTAGVPQAEIDSAKATLKEQEPKEEALVKLKAARDSASVPDLKKAIAAAKKAGIDDDDLKEFEDLVSGAESKEKAQKALDEALASLDVAALKFAIQQGKEAGLEQAMLEKAEAVLKEEEPKAKAREELEAAMEASDEAKLSAAIEGAKAAKLDASEYQEAADLLGKLAERKRLLAGVTKASEESLSCDMKDIDSVREAKDKLANAIAQALSVGVPESELQDAELRRKKLHNTVEDLKGSIRVFCRIRPLNSREKDLGDHMVTRQIDPMTLMVGDSDEHKFCFDAVFTPGTQDEIFEDCKDLVQSAVDGYNVTLFAYGQTGAGKTFTMAGVPGQLGVSPRTITELYRVIEQGKARYNYTVMGSMLELYRQDLVDLLSKGNPAACKSKLNVRVEKSGFVMVEHLTSEQCDTAEQLEALLERGTKARAVAATAMNSESSRSHLVLMIQIISVNKETKDQLRAKILIVDLAGSERLKKSQTTADAQKESIEINKSLTALGDVIEALTKNSKVIPYRNHKLTQLMQDSLGGSAKTLMFVNCSPASSNEDETLMSLKYAVRAKKITNNVKK